MSGKLHSAKDLLYTRMNKKWDHRIVKVFFWYLFAFFNLSYCFIIRAYMSMCRCEYLHMRVFIEWLELEGQIEILWSSSLITQKKRPRLWVAEDFLKFNEPSLWGELVFSFHTQVKLSHSAGSQLFLSWPFFLPTESAISVYVNHYLSDPCCPHEAHSGCSVDDFEGDNYNFTNIQADPYLQNEIQIHDDCIVSGRTNLWIWRLWITNYF